MHHDHGPGVTRTGVRRIAFVGTPNAGKTTLFNALAGTHARTGNYPGVTVARRQAAVTFGGTELVLEDLPGSYSLDPISPDERIVVDLLDAAIAEPKVPDAVIVVVDLTTLRRSLALVSHALNLGLPTTVVATFSDELARRTGAVNIAGLEAALGVPVFSVPAGDQRRLAELQAHLANVAAWRARVLPVPIDPPGLASWIDSVLKRAEYEPPKQDLRSRRIDDLLLHPIAGTAVFFTVMLLLFQAVFTWATPAMDLIDGGFAALGGFVASNISTPWVASLLGDALIGGIGGVLVFLPQIALLFLFIAVLEGTGYMARAAFLMDRVMSRFGLEGRAFVALLSSLACAVPGIMATRTLPSARDRIATMMAAPLMTCSARIPVYVLLIGLIVPADERVGPFGLQGIVMFALYLAGALASLGTAWVFSRVGGRRSLALPFYMEMPSYQLPRLKSVAISVWESSLSFVQKVATTILGTTIALWVLLSFPLASADELAAAGVDPTDEVAVSAYEINNSWAASMGRAVEPVFEPLGYDWRINVGIISSLAAREVFVSTMGQIASATDEGTTSQSIANLTVEDGPRAGEPLFTPAVGASVMAFFVLALQCMATVGVMRRETGGWRWPAIAFGYQFTLAWIAAFITYRLVGAFT